MFVYPYGDSQQLNLDWIINQLKELQAAGLGGLTLQEISEVFIALTYSTSTQYRRYDYCFRNEKLYRALNDNIGAWTDADWLEVRIGDDIPVLTRLLNAVDASVTSLQTTVGNQGTAITNLQNALNGLDSDDVDNASNVTGDTVSDALDNLENALNGLDSDDIDNASTAVSGNTVTNALDNLLNAISTVDGKFPVSVANGGTGETTIADAKTAFGIPLVQVSTAAVPANSTATIVCPNNARGILICVGSAGCIITVSVTSSGTVSMKAYEVPSTMTISTTTNGLVITNTSGANIGFYCIDFANKTYSNL